MPKDFFTSSLSNRYLKLFALFLLWVFSCDMLRLAGLLIQRKSNGNQGKVWYAKIRLPFSFHFSTFQMVSSETTYLA